MIGEGVDGLKIGDRVLGCTPSATDDRYGTYQHYSIAPRHMVAKIPENLSFEEAATIPLCFLTAVIAIFGSLGVPEIYSLASPPKLLVNGAGSAIGFYAAQLAKLAGLEVYVLNQVV